MCGIVGIVGHEPVNQRLYDALTVLQHRGQDAAGIVTTDGGHLHMRKANGLVRDVFRQNHMERLRGDIGIGHVRYPTAGSSSAAEAQPMYVNSPFGIMLAHNGNLTNAESLKEDLFRADLRHINTESDSEILLNVFAHELAGRAHMDLDPDDIFDAVRAVHARCRGAYAAVALIVGHGVLAFRDPWGIRPLVYGRRESEGGVEYMIASESVALDVLDFTLVRDVAPGEAVWIDRDGALHTRVCVDDPQCCPCIFEHVYLSRPDSIMDDISVYKARLRMGERLAERILQGFPGRDHDIDVVIPIPETSRTAALPLAYELNVKYREGFIKNRYIGRTFIMPGQNQRSRSVRQKLNAIDLEFRGKNVLLVDDSIVRGTTSRQIVEMAREAGARKVYLASAAPPVRFPNVYGIDMPAANEFVAHGRTEEEIGRLVGADRLFYQDLGDLISCAAEGNNAIRRFECSVFDGHYITGDVDAAYLDRISAARNDLAKQRREHASGADVRDSEHELSDLHDHV
ncbi:MAG: amidophosphoribosyltransferase [Pseudomonadales bacterium]|jgi:amidophosphoribosyltransferase|nr:amidophosphoribosyltransferase [Pseudomonadales bacterium]